MEILDALSIAHEETKSIELHVEKILNYVGLLRSCRVRIHIYNYDVHRRATLKRAERRIENRIKVLGKSL